MRKKTKKILLVANTSWYLYNFRLPLARALRDQGMECVLLSPRDEYSDKLMSAGFAWRELKLARGRLNPFSELRALFDLILHYRRERPDAAHHFTIKCVLYGTVAAVLSKTPAKINAITGLGHVFMSDTWKTRLLRRPLRMAYRWALRAEGTRTIFQNPDDRGVFINLDLACPLHSLLIRSSGVDIQTFDPKKFAVAALPGRSLRILFAGRLLREKGVPELMEAIRILRAQPETRDLEFRVAGQVYEGNPSSIAPAQIQEWQNEGLAQFLGHVDPIITELAACDLVVLPSHREGTPKILLEASAMEKPIVATDVPGCREAVENEKNGLLVPAQNPSALAQAIRRLVLDPELRRKLGRQGREKIVAEFSDVEIARQTLAAYEDLGLIDAPQVAPLKPPMKAHA